MRDILLLWEWFLSLFLQHWGLSEAIYLCCSIKLVYMWFFIFKWLQRSFIFYCTHNFTYQLHIHRLPAHNQHIFTTTVIIRMIQPMYIGKSCFCHFEILCFFIHVIDKLRCVLFYTFIIFCQIYAPDLFNKNICTFYEIFISCSVEI